MPVDSAASAKAAAQFPMRKDNAIGAANPAVGDTDLASKARSSFSRATLSPSRSASKKVIVIVGSDVVFTAISVF